MEKLSYKEREQRRRRHVILLEARRLILEGGFSDLNMDQLAEAVGISKPTLYQHFKSKEELIAQVLVGYMEEIEAQICATTGASPLETLRLVLRQILVQRYLVDASLMDQDTDAIFSILHCHPDVIAAKKQVMAQLNRVVEAAKVSGEIRASIPTPMVGCLMVKLFGLPSALRAMDITSPPLTTNLEGMTAVIEQVVDLFTQSVAQEKAFP